MLIKGGIVVDGTGAAARAADVRIEDGMITEVGENLSAADSEETLFDAGG